jgi:hypothetical protein
MAMLTFLRIGKEIHDETEEFLIAHLLDRGRRPYQKVLTRMRVRAFLSISWILDRCGLRNVI